MTSFQGQRGNVKVICRTSVVLVAIVCMTSGIVVRTGSRGDRRVLLTRMVVLKSVGGVTGTLEL